MASCIPASEQASSEVVYSTQPTSICINPDGVGTNPIEPVDDVEPDPFLDFWVFDYWSTTLLKTVKNPMDSSNSWIFEYVRQYSRYSTVIDMADTYGWTFYNGNT